MSFLKKAIDYVSNEMYDLSDGAYKALQLDDLTAVITTTLDTVADKLGIFIEQTKDGTMDVIEFTPKQLKKLQQLNIWKD